MKTKLCYRFVNEDMTSKQDGKTKWEVGKWNKQEGELKCCGNGLHASLTPLESLNNIYGYKWFITEYRGKIEKRDDKFCASEMRLIKEIPIIVIKRFALFCAKDCLKYYEKEYPNDNRISECIRITELYLDGKATLNELSAAWSAARSAAWSAARSAAESAARSAAESAARSAARSAAWLAAESAARSAAWSAARSAAYSAAWLAAESAARSAARSAAWSAARSAARSAAWSAARSAARSAAYSAQNKELVRLIKEYTK